MTDERFAELEYFGDEIHVRCLARGGGWMTREEAVAALEAAAKCFRDKDDVTSRRYARPEEEP